MEYSHLRKALKIKALLNITFEELTVIIPSTHDFANTTGAI